MQTRQCAKKKAKIGKLVSFYLNGSLGLTVVLFASIAVAGRSAGEMIRELLPLQQRLAEVANLRNDEGDNELELANQHIRAFLLGS